MSFSVQMSGIGVILAGLEIDFPEIVIIRIDASFPCTVENGDAVVAADFEHGIDYFLRKAALEILAVPTGEEEDFGSRIFFYQAFA